jgi:hypothetical protein
MPKFRTEVLETFLDDRPKELANAGRYSVQTLAAALTMVDNHRMSCFLPFVLRGLRCHCFNQAFGGTATWAILPIIERLTLRQPTRQSQ